MYNIKYYYYYIILLLKNVINMPKWTRYDNIPFIINDAQTVRLQLEEETFYK